MKKKIFKMPAFLAKKWVLRALVLLLILVVVVPAGTIFAKYITARNAKGEIVPALFYTNGEYVEKIESGAPAQIKASGWNEGISLKLYNHDGGKTSAIDLEYTVTLSDNWTYTADKAKLSANTQDEAVITLLPPETAEKGSTVSLEIKTSPYEITMKATFVLTDSNEPNWVLEDKGAYTLLTIHTNDYNENITVTYPSAVYAPDTTNALLEKWVRNGTGTFKAERFTTYELRFFEEAPAQYTFTPSSGSGSEIEITAVTQ